MGVVNIFFLNPPSSFPLISRNMIGSYTKKKRENEYEETLKEKMTGQNEHLFLYSFCLSSSSFSFFPFNTVIIK